MNSKGLEQSATQQRIDAQCTTYTNLEQTAMCNKSEIPPAVAEFALGRLADSKDPQRISDAADNCEVLRARLAKYEDVDGNPVAALKQPSAGVDERAAFEREDRYIVIKKSDLESTPVYLQVELALAVEKLSPYLPYRECLVIESDWPEYERAWKMIESRVLENKPTTGEQADNFTDRQLYDLIQQTHDNCMYGRNHNGWELSLVRAGIKLQARAASAPSAVSQGGKP